MHKRTLLLAFLSMILPAAAQAEPSESEFVSTLASELLGTDVLKKAQLELVAQHVDALPVDQESVVAGDSVEIKGGFDNLVSDPDPDEIIRHSHYWISNENAHYVWYPHVKDLGGAVMGVGSDQVLMIAGWMNASLIIPMDFDKEITKLHFVYGAALMSAENREDFRAFWKADGAERMKAALNEHFPDRADLLMKTYEQAQVSVNSRLGRLERRYGGKHPEDPASGIPTFVTDDAQYQHIRSLWLNHRVFPICGDLTGENAMKSIAEALNAQGMTMSVVYTSNAGQYFTYTQNFVDNFVRMPFSEKSLILRTRQLTSLGTPEPGDYHYNIQSGKNFQKWLETGKIADMPKMLRKRSKTDVKGLSIISEEPGEN